MYKDQRLLRAISAFVDWLHDVEDDWDYEFDVWLNLLEWVWEDEV
jgi:hypothetical protein